MQPMLLFTHQNKQPLFNAYTWPKAARTFAQMKKETLLSQNILDFLFGLQLDVDLPQGVEVLNPYTGDDEVRFAITNFYTKYYSDFHPRKLILGINPGRLGAGATGIPFTDTKRLNLACGIPFHAFTTHEPSSVFVYRVIDAFGGPQEFYSKFYIGSVCPLGFAKPGKNGLVNLNYYDDATLTASVLSFIKENIHRQLNFGLSRKKIYVLGTGKNFQFLEKLNKTERFCDELIPLEHPRYVMQYKSKSIDFYIEKYLELLTDLG